MKIYSKKLPGKPVIPIYLSVFVLTFLFIGQSVLSLLICFESDGRINLEFPDQRSKSEISFSQQHQDPSLQEPNISHLIDCLDLPVLNNNHNSFFVSTQEKLQFSPSKIPQISSIVPWNIVQINSVKPLQQSFPPSNPTLYSFQTIVLLI